MDVFSLALANLLTPMVLFFALGFAAGIARSDLTVPEAVAKGLALYLLLAIGFKGGVELARAGLTFDVLEAMAAGIVLGLAIPAAAFALLRATTALTVADAAAVAAHYGSISVVTFVAATAFLKEIALPYAGHMVAVMAIMETPAILIGLLLARRFGQPASDRRAPRAEQAFWREVFLNGSVVLLMGAFAIGWITGPKGMEAVSPFIEAPFKGVLCVFLLDMGLVAARRLSDAEGLKGPALAFGLYMPLLGGAFAILLAWITGMPAGDAALLTVLGASASYIAVPAALRLALPEANPAIALALSLGVTFPFNLTIGIPLYVAAAKAIAP